MIDTKRMRINLEEMSYFARKDILKYLIKSKPSSDEVQPGSKIRIHS